MMRKSDLDELQRQWRSLQDLLAQSSQRLEVIRNKLDMVPLEIPTTVASPVPSQDASTPYRSSSSSSPSSSQAKTGKRKTVETKTVAHEIKRSKVTGGTTRVVPVSASPIPTRSSTSQGAPSHKKKRAPISIQRQAADEGLPSTISPGIGSISSNTLSGNVRSQGSLVSGACVTTTSTITQGKDRGGTKGVRGEPGLLKALRGHSHEGNGIYKDGIVNAGANKESGFSRPSSSPLESSDRVPKQRSVSSLVSEKKPNQSQEMVTKQPKSSTITIADPGSSVGAATATTPQLLFPGNVWMPELKLNPSEGNRSINEQISALVSRPLQERWWEGLGLSRFSSSLRGPDITLTAHYQQRQSTSKGELFLSLLRIACRCRDNEFRV